MGSLGNALVGSISHSPHLHEPTMLQVNAQAMDSGNQNPSASAPTNAKAAKARLRLLACLLHDFMIAGGWALVKERREREC